MNQVAAPAAGLPKTTSMPANSAGEPPPHPGFDAPSLGAPAKLFEKGERSQATQIEQARAIAQVQAAFLVAQQHPRDVEHALEEMRKVCTIEMFADRAFFAYEKGGQTVNNGSIHLARECARIWGNLDYGIMELSRRDVRPGELYGESEMLAFAIDLQTNTRPSTTFIVPHYMDLKGGAKKPLKDARSIYENNANMGARRLREQIFAVIPRWFRDEAEDICRRTLEHGGGRPFKERLAEGIAAFKAIDVTPEMIEKRLGRPATQWTAGDLANLRIVYRSLKNGEITRDEAFPETPAADVTKALQAKAEKQSGPGPDTTAAAAPQASANGQDSAAAKPATVDHSATVAVILEKIAKIGTAKGLDNLVNVTFAEDIDLLRTEAPESHAAVMKAITEKRAWLARL